MLLSIPLFGEEHQQITFIENKGQWENIVRYKSTIQGGSLFFEQNAITYSFIDSDFLNLIAEHKSGNTNTKLPEITQMFAYRVHFLDANTSSDILPSNPKKEYLNFYLSNNPSQWKSDVSQYEDITYKNIYKGIDIHFYGKENTYKYDVIIAPYANPNQLKMLYQGVDQIQIRSNHLYIQIGKFRATELAPYAYQIDKFGEKQKIDCQFILENQMVSFHVGDYDKSLPLIIDPIIVFASYSGSYADNFGYTATYDLEGNLYGGGTVYGVGYPTTLGAFQINYSNNCDIGITKFSPDGTSRIFSTYLGGSFADVPHSLCVNNNNELYILATTSSINFPITSDAFMPNFSGGISMIISNVNNYLNGSDIAISRFNESGTSLLSSTYFGGSNNDGVNTHSLCKNYGDETRGDLQIDKNNNIYIASSTMSNDLPVTTGAFQPTLAGAQDGFVAKFSYNLQNLIFCSYLGGNNNDAIYSTIIDKDDNLYVCGGTLSNNFPTTQGALSTSHNGIIDGFVSKIATSGTQLLHSTFIGSQYLDQAFLIDLDNNGNVYVMGQTNDSASNWIYNVNWHSGNGQFLCKLNNSLSQKIWSTSFGNANLGYELVPSAMMVDVCGRIHISGWGGFVNAFATSTLEGLPLSNDAFKTTCDRNGDFYMITIGKDAAYLEFASYFGGNQSPEHVDGGTSRFDKNGTIYQAVCAGCGKHNDFPVTQGAVGPTNNSNNCNLGVVKIQFATSLIIADFKMPSIVCAPYTISFENTSQLHDSISTQYQWDFGDSTNSNLPIPSHDYTKPGIYEVVLIITDSSSCNISDTISKKLLVLSNKIDTLPTITTCKTNTSIQIGIEPFLDDSISYLWQPSTGLSDSTSPNPFFFDTTDRTYFLFISNGACVDTLVQQIELTELPENQNYHSYKCHNSPFSFYGDSTNANTFIWSKTPSFKDTINTNIYSSLLNIDSSENKPIQQYYLQRSDNICAVVDTLTILTSSFTIQLDSIPLHCKGDTIHTSVNFMSQEYSSSYSAQWRLSNGYCSGNKDSLASNICLDSNGFLLLTLTNEYGCQQSDTLNITVININAEIQTNNLRCFNDSSGSIFINAFGGLTPYSYQWQHTSMDTNNFSNLIAGTYSVRIIDKFNCFIDTSILIQEPQLLQAILYDTISLDSCTSPCAGKANILINGGTPPYRYQWNNGCTSLENNNLCPGTYIFTLKDTNLCVDSIAFTVFDTSSLELNYNSTKPLCFGDCNGKITIEITGGTPPYAILWQNGSTDSSIENICAGTYNVLIVDSNSCKRQLFPELTQPNPISLNFVQIKQPTCNSLDDAFIIVSPFGGTPPYRYFWNNTPLNDSILSNISAGTYHLKILDYFDCQYDTSIVVENPPLLNSSIIISKTPCKEVCLGTIDVTTSGGIAPYTYNWSTGDSTPSISNLCIGDYSLVVTDSLGCKNDINITIEDSSYFSKEVDVWADTNTFYRSQHTFLHATDLGNEYSYSWTPSDNVTPIDGKDVKITPLESTLYTVIVTDKFGCQISDTISIYVLDVICQEPYVFVPNAFSPNNDGINDILYVRGEILEKINFAIYNRWGEKLFETTDKNIGWNGLYKNKICEPGVYVYYLQATCIGGLEYIHKGNITLIR